mmetsp:Transcript_42567/g.97610  ORF Transcript_42567/g.97610 Transcript_42567/m.97610 type:complete len:561 (+) Transcript_42567:49-1731(+)
MAAVWKDELAPIRKACRDVGWKAGKQLADAMGQENATVQLARAEVLLAADEHEKALQEALEARASAARMVDQELEVEILCSVLVPAYCCLQSHEKAVEAADEAMQAAAGDNALVALALNAQLRAHTTSGAADSRQHVVAVASQTRALQAQAKDKAKGSMQDTRTQGHLALCMARIHLSREECGKAAAMGRVAMKSFEEVSDLPALVEAAEVTAWCEKAIDSVAMVEPLVTSFLEQNEAGLAVRLLFQLVRSMVDLETALESNESVLQSCKRLTKQGEPTLAEAKSTLCVAHSCMNQFELITCIEHCKATIQLLKPLQERRCMADAYLLLAKAQTSAYHVDAAMVAARQAVLLYRQVMDKDKEQEVQEVMALLWTAVGQPMLAPNRPEVEKVLGELKTAVTRRSTRDLQASLRELDSMYGWAYSDLEAVLAPITALDSEARAFLKEQGLRLACTEEVAEAAMALSHKHMYLQFRSGGLGYGPHFRCNTTPFTRMVKGAHVQQMSVLSLGGVMGESLTVPDGTNVWEALDTEMLTHPGMMDSVLHTGAAVSAPLYRAAEKAG